MYINHISLSVSPGFYDGPLGMLGTRSHLGSYLGLVLNGSLSLGFSLLFAC